MRLLLFILLVLSILQIIFPVQMLMFGRRWQFRDGAEPSNAAILLSRICAVVSLPVILFLWLKG